MKTFEYVIQDPVGLHARPASKLVQELTKFKSSVMVSLSEGEKTANAKSIINLMALGIKSKSRVVFSVEGEDEELLIQELPEILKKYSI